MAMRYVHPYYKQGYAEKTFVREKRGSYYRKSSSDSQTLVSTADYNVGLVDGWLFVGALLLGVAVANVVACSVAVVHLFGG